MKTNVFPAVYTSVHIDVRTVVRYIACMVIYTAVCFGHAAALYAAKNALACTPCLCILFYDVVVATGAVIHKYNESFQRPQPVTWSWLLVL